MKRRDFIKNTVPAVTIPGLIGGYSIKAFAENSALGSLMGLAEDTNHVMVLIQLSGGNDGLNTVIPLDIYSNYYNARTNIALPENKILKLNGNNKTGLNTAMTGLQSMYNEGMVSIIQAVGYPTPNFSHFRATDIWMSASDSNQYVNTGWAGRYLNQQYPNFPTGYPNSTMTDPLGIQIGSVTSLTFQGPSVNLGMSISNTSSFYNIINGVQDPAPNNNAGKELKYIRNIARQTQQYATVIKDAAAKVTQQSTYPTNNSLADQLKIVARLIKGGLKTRVYMVNTGGFDTHSVQVNTTDTTTGTHANLLGNVSNAIKAFQDDLKFLGVDDRVVGLTFSEFGRRIKSNASMGTDHGAASPMFVFGKKVNGGVVGNSPNIPVNASVNDNIPFQYDFRSVYASIFEDWFCLDNNTIQSLMLKNFQRLPIIDGADCGKPSLNPSGINLIRNYPNPFEGETTIEFKTAGGHTLVQVIDMSGRVVANLVDRDYTTPITDRVKFNAGGLAAGSYYARLQNGSETQVRLMLKLR
jgi:uncharacterized protein (DUF1501 family)